MQTITIDTNKRYEFWHLVSKNEPFKIVLKLTPANSGYYNQVEFDNLFLKLKENYFFNHETEEHFIFEPIDVFSESILNFKSSNPDSNIKIELYISMTK